MRRIVIMAVIVCVLLGCLTGCNYSSADLQATATNYMTQKYGDIFESCYLKEERSDGIEHYCFPLQEDNSIIVEVVTAADTNTVLSDTYTVEMIEESKLLELLGETLAETFGYNYKILNKKVSIPFTYDTIESAQAVEKVYVEAHIVLLHSGKDTTKEVVTDIVTQLVQSEIITGACYVKLDVDILNKGHGYITKDDWSSYNSTLSDWEIDAVYRGNSIGLELIDLKDHKTERNIETASTILDIVLEILEALVG